MRKISLILVPSLIMHPIEELAAQDRSQARSIVVSQYGIVAAEHPFASQAGAMILSQGGHAVDAAVAANAVMGLVAPMSNGIGGDLFAIVYEAKSGKIFGLNASGWAPKSISVDLLKSKGLKSMPYRGIHSVTVPGSVEGWDKLLQHFGRMKFADVLSPAIRYAEEGFPVTELVAGLWKANDGVLNGNTTTGKTFLVNGKTPAVGEMFRNADLAWSYRQISSQGRDAFYKGEIAKRIVECSSREGGTLSAADLAEFFCEWVEPLSTTYHGWTVYELPPNGQGIAVLTMLNIMENFTLREFGHNSTRTLHTMIEAKKLAYADMLKFVADPKFAVVPVQGILSKPYAQQRTKLISAEKANCSVEPGEPPIATGSETVYLCVVDREGNMVSLIQSNYENFGSGLVADGTGFALQNRGALFSLDPKSPNVLAGRKRPLHTIIPAFMTKGDVRIAFGIMGGWNQSQAHAQFVSNVVDHGMNIQSALEAPRFTKRTFGGCDVQIEDRVTPQIRTELESLGHKLDVRGQFSTFMGGGQAVMRDFSTGVNYGASDPRKDGAAIPEPLPKQ